MEQVANEFREFVVGFADPLTRLAFLLTAGTSADPAAHSAGALARVRRQWRDAEVTGAPESLAVEALLSALPHPRQFHLHGQLRTDGPDDAERAIIQAGVASAAVNHAAFRRPVAPADRPNAEPPEGVVEAAVDGDVDHDVDLDVLHAGVWKAWQRLSPRQRVPLVFVDPSVASQRLAGLAVPESFASARKLDVVGSEALTELRSTLAADPTVGVAVEKMRGQKFTEVLADTLRAYASSSAQVIDPYPAVVSQAQRLGRRGVAVGAVLVLLVTGFVFAVLVSHPTKKTSAAGAASRSGLATAAPGRATQTGSPSAGTPLAPAAQPAEPVLVVPWAPRGNAVNDSLLLAHLTLYFETVHGDAEGQIQVLLATDTPTSRIAYVTSNSRNGVIQSWFYGPVGSDDLVEGATSYGGSLLPDSVLADGLIDSDGHEQLVVIAPPDTTAMQIADFDFNDPTVVQGFTPLPYQNGIAVKAMRAGDSASSFVLDVSVGASAFTIKDAPDIRLGPQFVGSVTSDGPPGSAPLASPSVERGQPDPTLVTEALQVAAVWEKSSPSVAAHPVVLWGGSDTAGTKLVVMRVKTAAIDLLVLEWTGDAPGLHGELLIHPTTPEVPVAFSYRALDGVRVGVIGSRGAVRAVLDYNGKASAPVTLDATGFGSFRITNPSPPPSNDAASDLDIHASVQLLDASGRVIATAPEPPSV